MVFWKRRFVEVINYVSGVTILLLCRFGGKLKADGILSPYYLDVEEYDLNVINIDPSSPMMNGLLSNFRHATLSDIFQYRWALSSNLGQPKH